MKPAPSRSPFLSVICESSQILRFVSFLMLPGGTTIAMGDYFLAEQLAQKFRLGLKDLEEAQACGLIQPTYRNGRMFFDSRQAYRLQAASLLRRRKKLSWREVAAQMSAQPLYQVSNR